MGTTALNGGKGASEDPVLETERSNLILAVPEAVKTILEIMRAGGRNSQTRLRACETILDRAGLPAVAASEVRGAGGGQLEVIVRSVLDDPQT